MKTRKIKSILVVLMITSFFLINTQVLAYSNTINSTDEKALTTFADGTVLDIDTRETVKNAKITCVSADDETKYDVKVDKDGNFKINGMKPGYYNWTIKVPGYDEAIYSEYPVAPYGTKYCFEVKNGRKINKNYRSNNKNDENKNNFNNDYDVAKQTVYLYPLDPEVNVPAKVTVYRSDIGQVQTCDLEWYIAHVTSKEINPNIYSNLNLPYNKMIEACKAQAVAARSYATYHTYVSKRHSGTNYLFCDGQHCQAIDFNFVHYIAQDAAYATPREVLIERDFTTGHWNYAETVFFASCNGQTKSAESVWGNPVSYLQSVSCPYDREARPTVGVFGHCVGLCQDGTVGYAKNGYYYETILNHYYTGLTLFQGNYK